MILTDVQNYLRKYNKASLADLSLHFRMDTDALRPILNKLIRKGRIRQMDSQKCGGCTSCGSDTLELYEWVH
ncbi:MAG: FeoC-like transcriptional regulator [Microcystaceae cyanobacterium]